MKKIKTSKKGKPKKNQKARPIKKSDLLLNSKSRLKIIAFSVIIILGFLIYLNTFDSAFQFDDRSNIVENSKIRSLGNFTNVATWIDVNSRPLSNFTFALNYHFNALDVFGFHLINIIIHIMCGLFVFLFTDLLLSLYIRKDDTDNTVPVKKTVLSLFAALLFISHPIQTQSVSYIVQRMTALAGLFYVISIYLYARGRIAHVDAGVTAKSIILYIFAILMGLLGILSKQNAATFPLAMLLFELFFIRSKDNRIYSKYLVISISSLFIIFLVIVVSGNLPSAGNLTRWEYLITQFRVIITYIQLLILPVNQSLNYTFGASKTIWGFREIGSLTLIIALLSGAVLLFKKNRMISFGIFWFFLTLSIESSIIPILDVIFEHRLYLPSIGYFFCIIGICEYIYTKKRMQFIIIFLSVLTVTYSIATYRRNNVWKNPNTLWENIADKNPNDSRALNNLAESYARKGDLDNAITYLKRAIEISPNFFEALFNIGTFYFQKGDLSQSLEYYNKALQAHPDHPKVFKAFNHIAKVYKALGNTNKALEYYEKALRIKDDNNFALYNISLIYAEEGDVDKAILYLERALKFWPKDSKLLTNAGILYGQQGDIDKAIYYLEQSLEFDPDNKKTLSNLGIAWYKKGDIGKARKYQKNAK